MQGFIFGKGTDAPDYESLKRKRKLADMLLERSQGAPLPSNAWEGVNMLAQTLAGRYLDKKIKPQEDAAQQAALDQLMQIKGGLGPEGITPDQFQGLGGILENDYAAPMVETLARSLMRRQVTGINGETVDIDPSAPMMQFAAMDSGGGTMNDAMPLEGAERAIARALMSAGMFDERPTDSNAMALGDSTTNAINRAGNIPGMAPALDRALKRFDPRTELGADEIKNWRGNMLPYGAGSGIPEHPLSGRPIPEGPYGRPTALDPQANAGGGVQVAGDIKLTEGQSKDLGFWNRMDGVSADLDRFESTLTDAGERTKGSIPLVGNALVSEDYQRGRRAAEEWVAGILRKDTGAAVTKEEMDRYDKIYIPQAFDDPATVEDKRAARQRAMESLKKGLGIAEILADELAAARAKSAAPEPNDGDADLFKKYGLEP